DTFVLTIADTDNSPSFSPEARIYGPTGAYLGAAEGTVSDQIQLQASATGTYTVVVSAYTLAFAGTGHYSLGFAKTPGPFVVPTGDRGGTLRNGILVSGEIPAGDIDMWSFVTTAGSHVSITVANPQGGSPFVPLARIYGPTGAYLSGITTTGTI